ncbi:hypothetical protein MPSEU_000530300 [Mayamaea pseudoterrestris]|nr:hypothetical protein MPSEU_000530300 [Mayamaea pseudoterrestris]
MLAFAIRYYARRTPALVNGSFVVTLVRLLRGVMRQTNQQVKRLFLSDTDVNSSSSCAAPARKPASASVDGRLRIAEQKATGHEHPNIATDFIMRHSSIVLFDEIQDVLKYWFGQYTMDQARHCLWMIPKGSEHQASVDACIFHRFAPLLQRLTAQPTHEGECELLPLHQWTTSYGYHGKIAAIIVLDQFSRHLHRHFENLPANDDAGQDAASPAETCLALPSQQSCDQLALKTAQSFLQDHAQEIRCGMVPHTMYIFGVMPLRHQTTIESVSHAQQHVQSLEQLTVQCDVMVRRFRQATNRRMAVLQDGQRRTQGNRCIVTTNDDETMTANQQSTVEDNAHNTSVSYDEILECGHFDADMGPSNHHLVHQAIVAFLQSRNICTGEHQPLFPVIVSLSGGVDSMVIASVLSHLTKIRQYNLQIYAVHIDYANRPESSAEASYCQHYCKNILGNVTLEICRIDHVTRGVTARDEYETVSRQVRFDAYRRAIQQASFKTSVSAESIGIFLGHHRGDLRENVLSNAHKGCGPIELSGMTAVSRNDGVTLFRPLLSLEKVCIFDYAHLFGVPYFKDTTPHWSTRGKLRNKLLPLLEEIYGEGSMNNLSDLAVESDQCRALLRSALFKPFLDKVQRKPMGIVFETDAYKGQGVFFWKFVLRDALHSAAIGMFSDKAVPTFLNRIRALTIREGWLQCRKDCGVYLQHDGRVFVMHAASFPWRRSDKYDVEGQELALGAENAVYVGPWRIEATEMTDEARDVLDQRAVTTMDDLMNGRISYCLQARTWSDELGQRVIRPLVFQRFTKATRPEAWKSTEVKIQETLPLAGADADTAAAIKDPMGCGACHINIYVTQIDALILLVRATNRMKVVLSNADEESLSVTATL